MALAMVEVEAHIVTEKVENIVRQIQASTDLSHRFRIPLQREPPGYAFCRLSVAHPSNLSQRNSSNPHPPSRTPTNPVPVLPNLQLQSTSVSPNHSANPTATPPHTRLDSVNDEKLS
ncbi:hypothetical protein D9758_013972 [Tetrapyrgos nigripes]|uniref:Uncharacterized protein n=1 Tax=Tetrapyrgos nigripes TaxID=182062 RepID=A0A8H5G838_9AGAR|nr:hypothetical protein D9758_013972 [Tetrapyrgos nigripes]